MDLDSLYTLVTEAIMRAEALADLGSPEATAAHLQVSLLEEQIADELPADDPEGAVARRGAVRAAVTAGNLERAAALVHRFDPDIDNELRQQLRILLSGRPIDSQVPGEPIQEQGHASDKTGVQGSATTRQDAAGSAAPTRPNGDEELFRLTDEDAQRIRLYMDREQVSARQSEEAVKPGGYAYLQRLSLDNIVNKVASSVFRLIRSIFPGPQ